MRAFSDLPAPLLRVARAEYLTRLGRSLARSVRRLCRRLRVLSTRSRGAANGAVSHSSRLGRGGNCGTRVCDPVGSSSGRGMLRFRTFAVLVAFVGTFSVSKLVDIVEDNIGGDDARVGRVCRVHAQDIFLNLHENSAKSPMCGIG